MPDHFTRLKEAMLRIVRHVRAEMDRLMPFHFTSVLIGWLIAQNNGLRLITHSAVLVVGTALFVRCAIYLVAKPRVCKPLRDVISSRFASWPPALGFSVMLFLGGLAILAGVMALSGFVTPADSWMLVTFGFLYGVTITVMQGMGRGATGRTEESMSDDLQAPVWIRYNPLDAHGKHLISASDEAGGK